MKKLMMILGVAGVAILMASCTPSSNRAEASTVEKSVNRRAETVLNGDCKIEQTTTTARTGEKRIKGYCAVHYPEGGSFKVIYSSQYMPYSPKSKSGQWTVTATPQFKHGAKTTCKGTYKDGAVHGAAPRCAKT